MVKKAIKKSLALVGIGPGNDPRLPTEDPSVKVLRERQIRDLAELDEEENRRLKTAFRASRGIRAFRRSGGVTSSSAGRTGQRAFTRSGRGGGSPKS